MAEPSWIGTSADAVPITLVRTDDFAGWRDALPKLQRQWVSRTGFRAEAEQLLWLPEDGGQPGAVAVGWNGSADLASLGSLPERLPAGDYRLATPVDELQLLGFALGSYRYDRYRAGDGAEDRPRLVLPTDADGERLEAIRAAVALGRDLINTPASDMLPSQLAGAAQSVAEACGADCQVISGDALLDRGFRTIHAVGRASADAPRLIDLSWGDPAHPRVTLVGKGVCFDSGGLDIKPASNMRTMKKDMGGAAIALGLAQLIMALELPVRLRLLIPAVENAISGNAYRPGDVIETYQGLTVEIDNTDAEGRLVLCDALALAVEEQPALLLDFATLTGSARSAVGAEIAALFCNDDAVAEAIVGAGQAQDDAVWRLPLHAPYGYKLDSKVADTVNSASTPFAGAVTAALFLQKFVADIPWAHFDVMAYNTRNRPGRPEGGEAMALRAVFAYLETRYGR